MLIYRLMFVRANMDTSMNYITSWYHKSRMIYIWNWKLFSVENAPIENTVVKYFMRLSGFISGI